MYDKEFFKESLVAAKAVHGLDFELKQEQEELLFAFLNGKDCIGVLPTNFGKSMIYQLAPSVHDDMARRTDEMVAILQGDSMLIVVSPTNALIDDQIESCERLGITARKLCSEEIDDINEYAGEITLLYSSPECLLEEKFRTFLLDKFQERIIGIVIDEAHLVVKWGTSNKPDDDPFREAFKHLGQLRGYFSKPFLCLTATANRKTRKNITKILGLKRPHVTKVTPEKPNIMLNVIKVKSIEEFMETPMLIEILEKLRSQPETCEKTIIYCHSYNACGLVYLKIKSQFPRGFDLTLFVEIFHGTTPVPIQNEVLADIVKDGSTTRIIIATNALGVGVNIKNIRNIVHWGVPSDIEGYVQEIGRAGRDQKNSKATLIYKGNDITHCRDKDLVNYIKNVEKECRRKLLMSFFNCDYTPSKEKHLCCDVCSQTCNCNSCF
ncbi:ATP-dependent DNA helicase RecQ-like [Clytia hemisphaerica]|uniref:DNA 3'-5' helicase n=1 Tax=Clytia hemisphaerica TaxID=252671 RepID=A0A7M5X5A7_9CNID|eukprot:TCONS_00050206-protein